MRAVAVRKFGAAPELMELPRVEPRAGDVRIRLAAAGLNPLDWKVADGMLDGRMPHTFPLVLGVDGAGTVEKLGADVTRFAVGDLVYGRFLHAPVGTGTDAEYVTAPEGIAIARAPRSITAAEAAAVPTAGMTALQLADMLDVSDGQTLLIVGATGGVGSFATQLAAARGARVIATARADQAERMRALGARETVDHTRAPVVDQLRATHPTGVDALIDLVSDAAAFSAMTSIVRCRGAVATTVHAADAHALRSRELRGGNFELNASAGLLHVLSEAIDAGYLCVPIGAMVPLAEAPAAIAESRAGHAHGKTVILI